MLNLFYIISASKRISLKNSMHAKYVRKWDFDVTKITTTWCLDRKDVETTKRDQRKSWWHCFTWNTSKQTWNTRTLLEVLHHPMTLMSFRWKFLISFLTLFITMFLLKHSFRETWYWHTRLLNESTSKQAEVLRKACYNIFKTWILIPKLPSRTFQRQSDKFIISDQKSKSIPLFA